MMAPQKFAEWLSQNVHIDREYGHEYRYHPRSDAHSKALFKFVLQDLVAACKLMQQHAAAHRIAFGINLQATWDTSRDKKRLDLAIGTTKEQDPPTAADMPLPEVKELSAILFSCEGKAVMTEHIKSKPRLFDELSSSHAIVRPGNPNAIAAGIVVVNIADHFLSPTNQKNRAELR